MRKTAILLTLSICMLACTSPTGNNLHVSIVNEKPTKNIVAAYEGFDKGKGNTSVAFDAANVYKWSGDSPFEHETLGYFDSTGREIAYIKRDRDLGQTFTYTGSRSKIWKSVTVRLGFGTNVVRQGMYGKNISIQIFEVTGEPVLNNNGSDEKVEAFHGFPHNRPGDSIASIRDDYFIGETYTSIGVFTGAKFPSKTGFGFANETTNVSPDDSTLKGRFLRFEFPVSAKIELQPGKKYAFLIMIDEMGFDVGFTLANNYYGSYEGGHGIRRDGNGVFPPVPADPAKDFTDPANKKALESAHFPTNFQERIKISPGTNGYPDVCTWRDLSFFVEAE